MAGSTLPPEPLAVNPNTAGAAPPVTTSACPSPGAEVSEAAAVARAADTVMVLVLVLPSESVTVTASTVEPSAPAR